MLALQIDERVQLRLLLMSSFLLLEYSLIPEVL